MKDRERLVVSGLVALMLLLWLGFLIHRSPRFAGGLTGGVLGVAAALLMLVPLAYLVVKRVKPLKRAVTRRVPMRNLLAWHIYAGILGPILAILHTGHKFESPLGIAVTAVMLVVVVSGFVGRYLMRQISKEIQEKKGMLEALNSAYRETVAALAGRPERELALLPVPRLSALLGTRLLAPSLETGTAGFLPVRAVYLAQSIADLEYAVKTHQTFKRLFAKWLKFHIVISLAFYALMALHVWGEVYLGLRWFE
ncbi:MAG TPA: hypothetical protein ENJ62_07330 [Bryobacterales bacterium]|nr:hypothetical protein [Bryobacterales bacterium]